MDDNRNTRGHEAIVGPHTTYMAMTPETTSHDCPEWKRRLRQSPGRGTEWTVVWLRQGDENWEGDACETDCGLRHSHNTDASCDCEWRCHCKCSLFFVSVGHEELVRDGGVGTRNEVTLDSLIGLSWTRAWKMKLQRPFLLQYEDFDKDFSQVLLITDPLCCLPLSLARESAFVNHVTTRSCFASTSGNLFAERGQILLERYPR